MNKIDKNKIRTWLVTGASSGLGQELCKQLLLRGYNVVAIARRLPDIKLNGGGYQDKLLCLSCDVTKPEDIKSVIKNGLIKFGEIDVLANFAGITNRETFEEVEDVSMRSVMETNFWGTYNTCREIIEYFRKNNKGTIVNCGSVLGLVPRVVGAGYCSSKYAIEGLTGVLWMETRKLNTRVMCVEPGSFLTNMGKGQKFKRTEYDAYKFPYTDVIKVERPFRNDNRIAVNCVIDTVELKTMPRRLMLGRDCIARVKHEQRTIAKEIKYSERISRKIARIKDGDRQFTCNDYAQYKSKQSRTSRFIIKVLIKFIVDKNRYKKLNRNPNLFFNNSKSKFIKFLGKYYK